MRKLICIFLFIVAVGIFSAILPYPILSNHTNITESDAYQINNLRESEISRETAESAKVLTLDFSDIDALLPIGTEFELCDLESEQIFTFVRTGGKNHADIEPATTVEYENLRQTFDFSWERRPAIVKLNENAFLPCSLAAYPHGYNKTDTCLGHFCLHFFGSKTDGTNEEDFYHQKCVKKALDGASSAIELFD